jgi:hypothetical protein
MRRFTVTVLAATAGFIGLAAVAAVGQASATTPPATPTATVPAADTVAGAMLRPVLSCVEVTADGTEVTLPDLTSITLPDFSKLTLPDFSKLTIPGLTDLTLPDFSGISLPDLSQFTIPDLSGITLPDLSSISLPDLNDVDPADPTVTQSQPVMPRNGISGSCQVGPTTAVDPFEADAKPVRGPAGDWAITVTINPASLDAVNRLAAACFAGDATCPTKQLAIEVGGMIVAHPTVQAPALDGELQISGAFTEAEATLLAAQING